MGQLGNGGSGNGDFGGETNGASAGPNPWQKLLMGGLKGGLQGFSNMQNQNQMLRQGGAPMQVPMPQQPQVQLPGTTPNGQMNDPFKVPRLRGNNLSFYGDSQ